MKDENRTSRPSEKIWSRLTYFNGNYVWQSTLKDFSDIECNEKELAFIKKWGLFTAQNTLRIWMGTDDSQKVEYYELEDNYSLFSELLNEHYEDLKLYALMYRNVPLYNISNDALSVLYFVSKKDEIIGFKEKLQKENSPKAQIAFLYYANEALFPKFCIKYANVNFQNNRIASEFKIDTIKNFKNGNFTKVLSIHDLTEEECEKILSNKDKIEVEYFKLINKYLGESLNFNLFEKCDKIVFAKEYYIPIMTSDSVKPFHIRKFIIDRNGKNYERNRMDILSFFEDRELQIKNKENKINEIKEELNLLMKQKNGVLYFTPKNTLTSYQRELIDKEIELENTIHGDKFVYDYIYIVPSKEEIENCKLKIAAITTEIKELKHKIEQQEKEVIKWESDQSKIEYQISDKNNEINKITEEIKSIKENNDDSYKMFIENTTNHVCFKTLYDNQDEIEHLVSEYYEVEYNTIWLNDSKKKRSIESKIYNVPSICYLRQNEFKPESGICIYKYVIPMPNREYPETSKLKNGPYVFLNKRGLIQKWCNIIDEEVKRLEEIEWKKRKEEERELRLRREREEKQRSREEEARRAKFEYNKRNRHQRDSDLSFDESTHLYEVDGVILQSVTNFVKGCFPKFDAEYHAKRKAEQLGIAQEEVLEMWERKGKESRELGTELHKRIENYHQGIMSNVDDKTFNLFKMFADKIELKPYRTEWAVYDLKHNIAGTIDFVDYQNGEYIIYDWKRSDKIIENGMPVKINKYGEKGNHPLEHLDNTPYYHYALQLSLYKYILEKNYGMKISDLRLGIFHPSYNKPYVLRMPYLEKEINDIFSLRSEVIF